MATARKKKVTAVEDDNAYSKLDQYSIWLHEFYQSLLRAGFKHDVALGIIMDKDSYPDWVEFKTPTDKDIIKHIEEEEE